MTVVAIAVPELGNRSYLVHDGQVAVVIDACRRYRELLATVVEQQVEIAAVFETHIHNDYVTGGYALAQELGVPYYVAAADKLAFTHRPIAPDETVTVGELRITALAAPGHTFHHTSYLVEHDDAAPALFSGGSLLYGAVGRPDLVSSKATIPLAEAQYRTAEHYKRRLSPDTLVYPTHGFGSFCAATETDSRDISTLADELQHNHVYVSANQPAFVKELLAGLDAYPAYYAYMAPANLQGPLSPDLAPPARLAPEELQRALHDGAAVIDMRQRRAYAANHLPGTYNIELGDSLATYVGWLVAWQAPLILIAESAEAVAAAQEQLSLIGREQLAGQAEAAKLLSGQAASYAVRRFSDLAAAGVVPVLDVRRHGEWRQGHIKGALSIPLHELQSRLAEVPAGEVWVHCAGGFRAAIAASILQNAYLQPVLIDDNFSAAGAAGLTIIKEEL